MPKIIDYKLKIRNIIENAEKYHKNFNDGAVFTGPSLYFHRKALKIDNSKDLERSVENIYAVLVSWGMHRMGKKGSKMNDFDKFKESINSVVDDIYKARKMRLEDINSIDFDIIENIFKNINVMESKTILVGNSKVMAHLLPNLIPPVDRNYTLRYMMGNTNIVNGKETEWKLFKGLIINFFNPIASDPVFLELSKKWMKEGEKYKWDTSIPKIIDNLIIGSFKE